MALHPTLTDDELNQFDAFGFIVRRQAFAPSEVADLIDALESVCTELIGYPPGHGDTVWETCVAESHPALMKLFSDDRIFLPVAQLLGEDFLWIGSEGMWGFDDKRARVQWHADGGWIREQMGPFRLKVMLYLDPQHRDTGALRILPGSHRSPYHDALMPYSHLHLEPDQNPMFFFGVAGEELPSHAIETQPGDIVFFNNWLFHSAYGKVHPRRSIVLQYTAAPTTDFHRVAMRDNGDQLDPHATLVASDDPRIQQMVERTQRASDSLRNMPRANQSGGDEVTVSTHQASIEI